MTAETNALDQWVVLTLDGREYGLPVCSIAEVLRMVAVRPLPETPDWIAGVLNLRGTGIMVLDLRRRLGLPARAPDLNTQIVIVETATELLGLIADEVIDIISLPPGALRPANQLTGASPMFAAVAHSGERLIFVLDLDRLISAAVALDPLGVLHAGT